MPVSQVAPHHRSRYFHRANVSQHCLVRTPGEFGCSKKLQDKSELKSNLMESTRTAHQKSLEESVSHLHLEWEVLLTNPVLAPPRARFTSRALECSSFSVSSAGGPGTTPGSNDAPCMVTSFHFLRVEIHLSLFCSLDTITIHRVCLTCCLDPGATILRMCQSQDENIRCA